MLPPTHTVLFFRGLPVETVGRAMAEDAIAYHTSATEGKATELVANNSAIRRLAQPKVPLVILCVIILEGP